MTTFKKSITIEYKPLSASDSIATLSGNQRQTYDVNTGHFNPDRRLDPLTLLVNCSVNDPHNLVSGIINEQLTAVTWKITDQTGKLVLIDSTDKQFKIGTGADKGKITIYKNIPDLEETTIEFTAKYLEPKSKRSINLQRSFSLITVTEAVAQAELDLNAPYGTVMFPFVQTNGLLLQADLTRNGKKVPAAYYWKKDKVDIANQVNNTLPILTTSKVGNIYQVEVADCSDFFNELVNNKVNVDNDVIEFITEYNESIIKNEENLFKKSNDYINNSTFTILGSAVDSNIFYSEKYLTISCYISFENISILTQNRIGCEFSFRYKSKNGEYGIMYIGAWSYDLKKGDSFTGIVSRTFQIPDNIDVVTVVNNITLYSNFVKSENGKTIVGRPKIHKGQIKSNWSPSKIDVEELIQQKTDFYAEQTSLPPGYRPNPKPTVLYKKEIFVKKSYGQYEVDILYPSKVDPGTDIVRFEAVFRNNKGNIPDASKYFDIGWWKKTDGTYEYNGLVINVPIAKVESFIAANKGVEYTVIEKA